MTSQEPRKSEVLAIVLARGGSKGIKKKNLKLLGGVPLLGRALHLLGEIPAVGRSVVSTDDSAIASLALAYGAEIPFLRPAVLAEDESASLPALEHAVRFLAHEASLPPVTLLYQATSPFCSSKQICEAIHQFQDSEANYLKSVVEVKENPQWMASLDGQRLKFLYSKEERATRRQNLPTFYRLNGAISLYRTDSILAGQAEEGEPMAFIMDEASSIDLDTAQDWQQAEQMLAQQSLQQS